MHVIRMTTIDHQEERQMKHQIETITPQKAEKYLSTSLGNRKVRLRAVGMYQRAMSNGEWKLTGDAVKFDKSGHLIDGEHRLRACMKAEKPFKTLVVRGLEEEDRLVIDSGMARNMADHLKFVGYSDVTVLAAAASLICRWEEGDLYTTTTFKPNKKEIFTIVENNPALQASISAVGSIKTPTRGMSAALHFIFSGHDAKLADYFFTSLLDGVGLGVGSPILTLRNRFASNTLRRSAKIPKQYVLAFTIKAWNALRENKPLHVIKWNPKKENYVEPI